MKAINKRASIYKNDSKKKGFSASRGGYKWNSAGDRYFTLTSLKNGKTRAYESQAAAGRDGWYVHIKGRVI